jgi:hypothetical protein
VFAERPSEGLRDGFRRAFEVAVGEAEGPVAGQGVGGVTAAVALEALPGAVVPPAVGLDDEALSREEEVDLVVAHVVVDERCREAVVAADPQEEAFEVALGEGGAGVEVVERCPEPRCTGVPGMRRSDRAQGRVVG